VEAQEEWGRTISILCAEYGIKPWEVGKLTNEQIEMLMTNYGYIRHVRDLPMLNYHFGKMDDEGAAKMVSEYNEAKAKQKKAEQEGRVYRPPKGDSIRNMAWKIFCLEPYGLMTEEEQIPTIFGMHPIVALGIIEFAETEHFPIRAWKNQLQDLWESIEATSRLPRSPQAP
jgi:hypothetical protein